MNSKPDPFKSQKYDGACKLQYCMLCYI